MCWDSTVPAVSHSSKAMKKDAIPFEYVNRDENNIMMTRKKAQDANITCHFLSFVFLKKKENIRMKVMTEIPLVKMERYQESFVMDVNFSVSKNNARVTTVMVIPVRGAGFNNLLNTSLKRD